METCYESEYLTLMFDSERKILFTYWTTKEFMKDNEYRAELELHEKFIDKYQPEFHLVNSVNAKYVVPVDTQEWKSAKLASIYKLFKVKKVAIIMSADFMAQISNELVVEEVEKRSLKILFFDDEEKAFEWFESEKGIEGKAA